MVMIPELITRTWLTSSDRRWQRNINRYYDFVRTLLKERTDDSERCDFLSILNASKLFKGDVETMAHELALFMVAGMRTV